VIAVFFLFGGISIGVIVGWKVHEKRHPLKYAWESESLLSHHSDDFGRDGGGSELRTAIRIPGTGGPSNPSGSAGSVGAGPNAEEREEEIDSLIN
jgi:hypothetical protein